MSFIVCPNCQQQISTLAEQCPHCGQSNSTLSQNTSFVTIHGYTERFIFNPDVSIYKGKERVGTVSRFSKVDIAITEPCELKFSSNLCSAKCSVKPGDIVLLSWNRVTSRISASLTSNENLKRNISKKRKFDVIRIVAIFGGIITIVSTIAVMALIIGLLSCL